MGKYNEIDVNSGWGVTLVILKIGKLSNQLWLKEYVTSRMINTTFHVINVFERISFKSVISSC